LTSYDTTLMRLTRPRTKPAFWWPVRARDREGALFWGDSGEQNLNVVRPFLDESSLHDPLTWSSPHTIFVCPTTIDLYGLGIERHWRDEIRAVQARAPWHDYVEITGHPAAFAEAARVRANVCGIARCRSDVEAKHAARALLQAALGRRGVIILAPGGVVGAYLIQRRPWHRRLLAPWRAFDKLPFPPAR
jgi:hypothetical protein